MLVIFDLDGTLLDTMGDLSAAANHALQVCGFAPRSLEECRGFVGNGVTKLVERCLPEDCRSAENISRMKVAFSVYYDVHLADTTRPYPGIAETLATLQNKGVKLAVASNKYQSATERLIRQFFPQIHFVAVSGQRDNMPPKPHPAIVHEILIIAQETAATCLYAGDSDVDMQTARNAGIKACGVTWGFRPREVLQNWEPAYLIDTPAQLQDLV